MRITLNRELTLITIPPYYAKQCTMDALEKRLKDSDSLGFIKNTLPPNYISHLNYLEYLEVCWKWHYGAVISPDILWHIFLCELALVIAANPDAYRSLFTESTGQTEISVATSDPWYLPLDEIITHLRALVPADMNSFLPEFSTQGQEEKFALYAAFADMVSPYYCYSTYCCGIPFVDVLGTKGDYALLAQCANHISRILAPLNTDIKTTLWLNLVRNTFNNLYTIYDDRESLELAMRQLFAIEKCGSGSQYEVQGWITNLFRELPSLRLSSNFSSCVSVVKYKNKTTDTKYVLKSGLLGSEEKGGALIPHFGNIVYQDLSV